MVQGYQRLPEAKHSSSEMTPFLAQVSMGLSAIPYDMLGRVFL